MALQSRLFSGDPRLEAAAVSDPAHIMQGATGPHVAKIQHALNVLDNAGLSEDGKYGPRTAAAVLAYKRKRGIINRAYQTQPDDIVGKMTMASLDQEMRQKEGSAGYVCTLDCACPMGVPSSVGRLQLGFAIGAASVGGAPAPPSDGQVMQAAFQESRRTLGLAIPSLSVLQGKLTMGNDLLTDEDKRVFVAVVSWLQIDQFNPPIATPEGKRGVARHIGSVLGLISKSLAVKTSNGQIPAFRRTTGKYHAQTYGNPDQGVDCGEPFFTVDGPNCRRDVMTHEFFHFVGVHHGGGPLQGATIRRNITTPAQALDSADNLAQLMAEITTLGGRTDACARPNE
jgi:hypothetical protein